MILELEDVSTVTATQGKYLVQNISFRAINNDCLGVIGASGAGKTTLLRLINRLISPNQGKIYLDRQDISTIAPQKLRRQIVLLPQETSLLGDRVREAIAYPLQLQKLTPAEIDRRIAFWQEQLHLPDAWLDRTELQLSGGQKQVVAMARALVMQPQILLLDEPTSALDLGRARQLLGAIKNTGTTVLFVSHQWELIKEFCNRVLYFDRGRLILDQDIAEIDWQNLQEKLTVGATAVDPQNSLAEEDWD
jgi:D-methionine transport system ATP-binding protein